MKIEVPESELEISAVRSSGPGGQNVNKTATKAVLRWDFRSSACLSESQKARIENSPQFRNRINSEGFVVLSSQDTRSQLRNRHELVEKLEQLLAAALAKRAPRIKTRVGKAKLEKRKQARMRHSAKKKTRGRAGLGRPE